MWDEIKGIEDILKPIIKKWNEREKYITLMCISVIQFSCEQIEKTFDLTDNLKDFDDKRVSIQ